MLTEHLPYTNFYKRVKKHLDDIIPIVYRAQNTIKKQGKLMQFGDPVFPELMTTPAEELYETITRERFVELVCLTRARDINYPGRAVLLYCG